MLEDCAQDKEPAKRKAEDVDDNEANKRARVDEPGVEAETGCEPLSSPLVPWSDSAPDRPLDSLFNLPLDTGFEPVLNPDPLKAAFAALPSRFASLQHPQSADSGERHQQRLRDRWRRSDSPRRRKRRSFDEVFPHPEDGGEELHRERTHKRYRRSDPPERQRNRREAARVEDHAHYNAPLQDHAHYNAPLQDNAHYNALLQDHAHYSAPLQDHAHYDALQPSPDHAHYDECYRFGATNMRRDTSMRSSPIFCLHNIPLRLEVVKMPPPGNPHTKYLMVSVHCVAPPSVDDWSVHADFALKLLGAPDVPAVRRVGEHDFDDVLLSHAQPAFDAFLVNWSQVCEPRLEFFQPGDELVVELRMRLRASTLHDAAEARVIPSRILPAVTVPKDPHPPANQPSFAMSVSKVNDIQRLPAFVEKWDHSKDVILSIGGRRIRVRQASLFRRLAFFRNHMCIPGVTITYAHDQTLTLMVDSVYDEFVELLRAIYESKDPTPETIGILLGLAERFGAAGVRNNCERWLRQNWRLVDAGWMLYTGDRYQLHGAVRKALNCLEDLDTVNNVLNGRFFKLFGKWMQQQILARKQKCMN